MNTTRTGKANNEEVEMKKLQKVIRNEEKGANANSDYLKARKARENVLQDLNRSNNNQLSSTNSSSSSSSSGINSSSSSSSSGINSSSSSSSSGISSGAAQEEKDHTKSFLTLETAAEVENPQHGYKVTPESCGRNIVNPDASRVEQGPKSRLTKMTPHVMKLLVAPYLEDKEKGYLFTSCYTLYRQTQKSRVIPRFQACLQAMQQLEPNHQGGKPDRYARKVYTTLTFYPEFLLAKPKDFGMKEIKHHSGKLRYLSENESMFSMAQRLHNLNGVKAMLPCYFKELKKARTQQDRITTLEKELQDARKHKNNHRVAKLEKKLKDEQARCKDKPSLTELENAWILETDLNKRQKRRAALQEQYREKFIMPFVALLMEDTTLTERDFYMKTEASEVTLTTFKAFKEKLLEEAITLDFNGDALFDAVNSVIRDMSKSSSRQDQLCAIFLQDYMISYCDKFTTEAWWRGQRIEYDELFQDVECARKKRSGCILS